MPEGDTIHHAAARMRPILAGAVPDDLATPHPRFAMDRWPQRLAGRAVTAVDARGKHLLVRFEGDLVVHSHLRMTGAWVTRRADPDPRPDAPAPSRRTWLRIVARGHEVLQLGGPVLELMTAARARSDPRLAGLGPDILGAELDERRFLARLRAGDPARPLGDALLDQRTIAGIGNVWKAEGCFAAGIDPWRPVGEIADAEALAVVRATRPEMQRCARDGHRARRPQVYGRAGRPCPRCGTAILRRGQGDDRRTTYWCPRCQT